MVMIGVTATTDGPGGEEASMVRTGRNRAFTGADGVARISAHEGQVAERRGDVEVVGSQGLLPEGQGALVHGPGLRVVAHSVEHEADVAAAHDRDFHDRHTTAA